MVENDLIVATLALLYEWNLIAYAKLDKLADVHMRLSQGLKIYVIANAILDTETDIVEGLIDTRLLRLIDLLSLQGSIPTLRP